MFELFVFIVLMAAILGLYMFSVYLWDRHYASMMPEQRAEHDEVTKLGREW